jgi:uracil phosphoribosyltransferase
MSDVYGPVIARLESQEMALVPILRGGELMM